MGCTLLLKVDNSGLMDVAKGRVVTPLNRVFHTRPMSEDMFRVTLDRVFPDCESFDPPSQPPDADSQYNLGQCLGWLMLWPKELIRLDSPITTT